MVSSISVSAYNTAVQTIPRFTMNSLGLLTHKQPRGITKPLYNPKMLAIAIFNFVGSQLMITIFFNNNNINKLTNNNAGCKYLNKLTKLCIAYAPKIRDPNMVHWF